MRRKNDGGKNRKKKERKRRKKKERKRRKKREVNKTKGKKGRRKGVGGGGEEEDRIKNRNEKKRRKSWDKYLNKRKDCVGSEPSALVYIGILVTSTTTGHDGSVVCALASQGVQFPVVARAFFPTSIFFRTSVKKVIEQTIHQFGRILSGDATPT